MPYTVDFTAVSTVGLESSPVAPALAGLRANEARYFKNKYDHVFTVEPAADAQAVVDWVHRILQEERDIVIASRPLEATAFQVENIKMAYVFYESGLSINVMLTLDESGKRAVGFKLSDGMEVPEELASRFKFPGRSPSWPEPSAVPTSRSRTSTDRSRGSSREPVNLLIPGCLTASRRAVTLTSCRKRRSCRKTGVTPPRRPQASPSACPAR